MSDPSDSPRSFFIRTFGCQMNEHDTERIAGQLEADGLTSATSEDDADVIVLNTCCIRENADNRLYGTLGHLKSKKDVRPEMQIVVAGCLAQKDRDLVHEKAPYVDVVMGTHNVHRAAELIEAGRTEPVIEILDAAVADDATMFPSALTPRRGLPHHAWVTIQMGCDNSCAFCIVPAVRGPEISRPFDALVGDVKRLADDGVTDITLLGQNVNSYGRDLTLAAHRAGEDIRVRPQFAELLRAVGEIDGIRRVRFTSPHPKDLRPDVIGAMAEVPAVCNHLHLPLQSGSDRVLAAMHRGYTAARYLERLADARAAVDDLAVTTDIIVGFPGESEADFALTLEVAAEAQYDSAYTFIYSPRPGTEASLMHHQQVPADVTAERFERLRVVVERTAMSRHRDRVGRVEIATVEGPSRKDPDLLTARTSQNKLVHFASPAPLRAGTDVTVEITDAGTHHLRGELVEVVAPARHRTRIPVASD